MSGVGINTKGNIKGNVGENTGMNTGMNEISSEIPSEIPSGNNHFFSTNSNSLSNTNNNSLSNTSNEISFIQFEDQNGKIMSDILQIPNFIEASQLKKLIETDKDLYYNGILIQSTLESVLNHDQRKDLEQIKKITLGENRPNAKSAIFCSGIYSGHNDSVLGVKFNKEIAISIGGDKTVRFWNKITKTQFKIIQNHNHWVTCLLTTRKYIITGGMDKLINFYNFKGEHIKTLSRHNKPISGLEMTRRGIISVSKDGIAMEWTPEGEYLNSWAHKRPIKALCCNGEYVMTGDDKGEIKVYKDGEYCCNLVGHQEKVNVIACFVDRERKERESDRDRGGERRENCEESDCDRESENCDSNRDRVASNGNNVTSDGVTSGSKNSYVVSGDDAGTICIWKNLKLHRRLKHKAEVISLSVLPNGLSFVSGSFDKTVRHWCLETGELLSTVYHVGPVYKVSSEQDLILSCSKDKTLKIYKPSLKKVVSEFVCDDEIYDFDFREGEIMAGTKRGTVYFFG